ncbi:MAG: hypothetical protein DCC58_10195 [Chloroflexi bacterium]|nr:MAG: hypothetical protein DCC58_10195 [Chloroflexota bacterium]
MTRPKAARSGRAVAGQRRFVVQPMCWVVERTLGWLKDYRRLSKAYEELPASSEAMILNAMIHVTIRRLEE